eukprot:6280257-Amphidinium_carterae.1
MNEMTTSDSDVFRQFETTGHGCCKQLKKDASNHMKQMQQLIESHRGASYYWRILCPENKATALLRSHRQRPDTCRKPGTAFATEYKAPGTDARTFVQKSYMRSRYAQCRVVESLSISRV